MKRLCLALFSLTMLTSTEARADLTVPDPEPEPKKAAKKQDAGADAETESGGCAVDASADGRWALLLLPFAAFALRRRDGGRLG